VSNAKFSDGAFWLGEKKIPLMSGGISKVRSDNQKRGILVHPKPFRAFSGFSSNPVLPDVIFLNQ
jgi:hypothetical protein